MSCAAFHAFSTSNANLTADCSGLDGLAINNDETWRRFFAGLFAYLLNEVIIDPFPGAIVCPFFEIPVHRRGLRILVGDHFPLTARLVFVKERIQHAPETNGAWRAKLFSHVNIWLHEFPFCITHVAGILRVMGAFLIHCYSLWCICIQMEDRRIYAEYTISLRLVCHCPAH